MMAEFSEIEQSLEMLNHFGDMENPSIGLLGFTADSFYSQQPNFGLPFVDNLLGLIPDEASGFVAEEIPECKRSKTSGVLETSSGNNSGHPSESVVTEEKKTKKNSSGSGKRGRNNLKELEKQKEVVHVRARRGQATDSHSLAERVRREKINERMRYLQDLVPGCYKTMGMAGMLDEIINYVQSLQNQVEFLSMKLSAASSFYDFSMDNEAMTTPQIGNIYEAEEVEKLVREGYGGCTSFYSPMPF